MTTPSRPPQRGIIRPQVPAPPQTQSNANKVKFGNINQVKRGQRVVIYGTGGIGKTTLTCLAPGPVAYIDADESLPILKSQLEEIGIDAPQIVDGVTDWASLRAVLQAGQGWDDINTIVLDTATKIEEWAVRWTIENVKHEKGAGVRISSIEDYGFGKGYQHVFETFRTLIADLDRHVRQGRNVILIAHECTAPVPNPKGEDWIRYEPRLQNPSSGKSSIRLLLKEWADHVLFLGYDVAVSKDGKGEGCGSRTLYTAERPFCMAKSRTTDSEIIIRHGESPWDQILK